MRKKKEREGETSERILHMRIKKAMSVRAPCNFGGRRSRKDEMEPVKIRVEVPLRPNAATPLISTKRNTSNRRDRYFGATTRRNMITEYRTILRRLIPRAAPRRERRV